MKRFLVALVVLFALAGRLEASDRIHEIRRGETLSGIALRYLHSARPDVYEELARYNRITDPKFKIIAGKILRIPELVARVAKSDVTVNVRVVVTTKVVSLHLLDAQVVAANVPSVPKIVSPLPARVVAYSFLPAKPSCYSALIQEIADNVGIDSDLIRAVIRTESSCNPLARSSRGALGLMQLMPPLLRHYGVTNPFDAYQNVEAGAKHLKDLSRLYPDRERVLAAYNAGQSAVDRHRGVPPFRETRNYIARVKEWLHKFQVRSD